jgi:hypothetical protein
MRKKMGRERKIVLTGLALPAFLSPVMRKGLEIGSRHCLLNLRQADWLSLVGGLLPFFGQNTRSSSRQYRTLGRFSGCELVGTRLMKIIRF